MNLANSFTAHSEPKSNPTLGIRLCALPAALCEGGTVLTDEQAFLWRQRLRQERIIRNITDTHIRILEFTQGAIEDGCDDMSHAAVAEALSVGVRTVGDAYRRAKGIGLLEWDEQYRLVLGVRRRTVNRYRLTMPPTTPAPRPDLRRHRKPPPLVPKLLSCSAHSTEPLRGFSERFAAKVAEERRLRRIAGLPGTRYRTGGAQRY